MKLIQLEAGREARTIDVPELPVILGRQPPRGVAVPHPTISREHARVFEREGKLSVADLNSSNGTFVNGERVSRADLSQGDILRLGEVEFRIETGEAASGSPVAAGAAPGTPSAAELFGDDDGIQLEETHLGAAGHDAGPPPRDGTATFIGRPPTPGVGVAAAPPKSVYSEALRRSLDPKKSGNVFTADVAQQGALRRVLTILVAIAAAVGLFYGAMQLTEDVAPERALPDESSDTGDDGDTGDAGDDAADQPPGSGG